MKTKKVSGKCKAMLIAIAIIVLVAVFVLISNNIKTYKEISTAINNTWNEVANAEDQPLYLSELNKLSKFTIDSVKKDNGVYIVKTTVSAPDVGTKMIKINYNNLPSTENTGEINSFLCEQLKNAEFIETKAYIHAYKVDNGYQVSFSDEFVDAMCGKLYAYAQSSFVDMMQKYSKGELK